MFWHRRKQSDFDAEIEAHIALEADRLKEEGFKTHGTKKLRRMVPR